ncbi:glutaredoxin family protein [Diaphorobacter nitroreducens]|uniref:glutaredoxin family protein n=1 Tax=Diaphorobacter nitroreducens TaxID=164759 RepID=UPI0035ADB671
MSFAIRFVLAGFAGMFAAGALAPLHAQQVYRIVGPDGKVTFSDKPPQDAKANVQATTPAATAGGGAGAALPFELRNVANRYPVTLYTGPNCAPCGSGRSFLSARGIPFSERTVSSNDDIEALQRLSGSASLPFLTIGGQQIKGYSEVEWGQFLDAAGYPKTSQLPPGYRQAPAAPLVAVQAPRAPAPAAAPSAAPTAAAPAAPPPPTSGPTPDNPAGIRF